MKTPKTILAGLIAASSMGFNALIAAPAAASAQGLAVSSVSPVVCWIEERDREGSGSLLFFAGADVAGRYELAIRQDHSLQQLMAQQSGSFRGNGLRPTLLSGIFVRSIEPVEDVSLTSHDTSRAGNLTTIRAQRIHATPEPMAGRGYTAHLQVFDAAGRRICEYLY